MVRIALVSLTALVLILAISGSAPVPGTAPAPAAEQAPPLLSVCPLLKRGFSDPVEGKPCVTELQKVLRNHGYEQEVTGTFGPQTQENVRDFQRRNKIEPRGYVGPQTRGALLGDRAPAPDPTTIIDEPKGIYSHGPCTYEKCSLYLSRGTTRQYADLLASHTSAAVSEAILSGACGKLLGLGITAAVCGLAVNRYATPLQNKLAAAARQQACLRLTLRLLGEGSSQPMLELATDNTSRCAA